MTSHVMAFSYDSLYNILVFGFAEAIAGKEEARFDFVLF